MAASSFAIPRSVRSAALIAFVAVLLALSWHVSEVDLLALGGGVGQLARSVAAMFPPRLDPAFLRSLGKPILETVAIAIAGICGALFIAVPLAYFGLQPNVLRSEEGARPTGVARAAEASLHYAARSVLGILRTVPEIVWALMFVRAIGLGPAAGVLAIALSYAGVMGKVFAEIIEGVPRAPLDALRSTGAGRLEVFLFGALPQAFPVLLSYTLYRVDCALRSSAVLGLVGAGGLGFQVELSIKMMEYGEVLTEILVLFGLVAISDLLSMRIRSGFSIDGRGARPRRGATGEQAARRSRAATRGRWVTTAVLAFLALMVSSSVSGLSPNVIAEALGGFGSFFVRAFPPTTSLTTLPRFLLAGVETIGISFLGTVVALFIAFPLAVLGAKRSIVSSDEYLRSSSRRVERGLWLIVSWGARLGLNLLRTIPMMIFALLLVPAIGIGPFAGMLAIAFHTAGAFGRLYLEVIEEVDPKPIESLRSSGSAKTQLIAFAALPQMFAQLVSYFFYRWEVNLRESVILGVVGGGGIGQALYVSINLFQEHDTYALILLLFLLVALVDGASSVMRRWAFERGGEQKIDAESFEVALRSR